MQNDKFDRLVRTLGRRKREKMRKKKEDHTREMEWKCHRRCLPLEEVFSGFYI